MATKNFSGVLDAPIDGDFYEGLLRFTHLTTTGPVLAGSRSIKVAVVGGVYDFDLFYGEIVIESKVNTGNWHNHGSVIVNSETTATTLPALLLATTPATPELVQQLEAILSDAEAAADRAEAAAATIQPWHSYVRNEADMLQMIRENKNLYAANGYITPIEDFVLGNTPNAFGLPACQLHMDGFVVTIPSQDFTLPEASSDANLADRVDKYGFAFKLETIDGSDPYIYPSGNTLDVAGRVDFVAADDATKAQLVTGDGDNENNVYLMNDGTVKQLRVYQYIEAGTTNGDWDIPGLRFDKTKGDVTTELLYVMGSCLRLSKGKSHPFNYLGAALCSDSNKWYASTDVISDIDDCFTGQVGGSIASGQSGRDDGRFYDKIERYGKGGLLSYRVSAWDKSSSAEASKVSNDIKTDNFNGKEKLVFTQVFETTIDRTTSPSYGRLGVSNSELDRIRQAIGMPTGPSSELFSSFNKGAYAYNPSTGYCVNLVDIGYGSASNSKVGMFLDPETQNTALYDCHPELFLSNVRGELAYKSAGGTSSATTAAFGADGDTFYIIVTSQIDLPVGGEYYLDDVLGAPVNLLQITELANGWLGYWCPLLPTSSPQKFPFQRKNLNATPKYTTTHTLTLGSTWTNQELSFSPATNDTEASYASPNYVGINTYLVKSYSHEPSDPKPVLGAQAGLLGIFTTESSKKSDGVLIGEACANEILKSEASGIVNESSSVVKYLINGEIKRIKTEESELSAPTNGSKAVKVALYQVAVNQELYIGTLSNTMEHNGTDWGEYKEMQIPTGDVSTFPDANGNIQLAFWSISTKPYGYTKS